MLLAGRWYPATESACRQAIAGYRASRPDYPPPEGEAVAAVAPHAGWMYCGPVLAAAVDELADKGPEPDTVAMFGAIHSAGLARPALFPSGSWESPLGAAQVDEELAEKLREIARRRVTIDWEAHRNEHSIEVQLPFIREAFPKARILPIAFPPAPGSLEVGRSVARAAEALGRRILAVASTDLTHYGLDHFGWAPAGAGPEAEKWVKEENDPPLLAAIEKLDAEAVLRVARQRRNACGAGGVAASLTFAKSRGAKQGYLVGYSSSNADGGMDANFVTYGGAVLAGA